MTQAELEKEQEYVDRAYARLEDMLWHARAQAAQAAAASQSAGPLRDALVDSALARASHLAIGDEPLVFGRTDDRDGERLYIGRAAVYDEHHDPLVTDWRAPAAEPFYRATPGDTMGLVRRRHLMCRGPRVLRLDDELLDRPSARNDGLVLVGEGALLDALGRARTGRMRDIVATIQAEQDAVIRAPLDGVLVVQGGPGTGKTAVALHRAAYLLYTHRARLERSGVLIVGPNPIFLRYIDQVLPSLGETATLATVGELVDGVRVSAVDPAPVARVKGDVRMADVVVSGIRNLPRPLTEDAHVTYEGVDLVISVAASLRMVQLAKKRFRGTHNARHSDMRGFVLEYLWFRYNESRPEFLELLGPDARRHFESTVRAERSFRRAVQRMWPALSAQEFVRDLLASPSELSAAAGELLQPDERALLLRSSKEPWTELDAALVDEASEPLGPLRRAPRKREPGVDEEEDWMIERMLDDLQETEPIIRAQRGLFAERYKEQRRSLEDPSGGKRAARDRFGYVIVDEGQGLAPMQWRMIARRCPSGRMTILGDLGQAGATALDSWDEVGIHVGSPHVNVVELTINYRTPTEIMALAARVLAAAAPGVAPPQSVRGTDARPIFERARRETLSDVAVQAAADAKRNVGDGKVAIITAPSLVEPVALSLGIDLAKLDASALLDAPITVLATDDARGLEFDGVVVADPQAIVDESNGAMRALYVALTRSTQLLTVVPTELSDELRSVLRAG